MWKYYQPPETVVIDKLVIPPGLDMDNFLFGVNLKSEELLIQEQNARPHHVNYLYEKTFHLRKMTPSGTFEKRMPSRKDAGYTLAATAHEKIEVPK